MKKGLGRAFGGSMLYTLLGRTNRHYFHPPEEHQHFHFVLAHSDDELALLKPLKIIANNPNLSASFTLLTNSTQGYEGPFENDGVAIESREQFGRLRVKEFNNSLAAIGFKNEYILNILDERTLYEQLVARDYDSIKPGLDKVVENISRVIEEEKPKAIFVDDFAGGHIIHDIANFLTCCAARNTNYNPIIEFWQYFLDETGKKPVVVLGDLGYDDRGRITRDNTPGKYTLRIPSLGIKKGRMFLSPMDLITTLQHRKRIYASQRKTLDRLCKQKISYGVDAPRFRQIDLDTIDHANRPSHGVLYEIAEIADRRKRGLPETPRFEHSRELVESYQKTIK